MLQGPSALPARTSLSKLCPYVAVCSYIGTTAVENILKKAETLKDRLLSIEHVASDEERIVCQQMLQKIYRDALIRDLEYSLDHKAEVDLWNYGFRNTVVALQAQAKDKNNPKRVEAEYKLVRFLESASAFYTELLQDVCSAFDLDLPFRRNYGCPKKIVAPQLFTKPNKNSCYYLCHYCLVHLGDLARYRHLGRKAELFYRFAVQLSPCTGHPYNQLALVEAGRGDRLSTVFYYVRSVSLRDPFPAAALNLMKIFNQCVDEQIDVAGCVKLSATECVTVFLRFHGLVAKSNDLDVAEKYVKLLTDTLTALVATESLSGTQLVQMLAINLYVLHQKRECAFISQRTVLFEPDLEGEELQAKRLVLHLVAGSLCAYLLPVYTLKDGESLLDYFALPAIKLTLDWIRLESQVLQEAAFLSRRHIWPSLCKLLNVIQPYLLDVSADIWGFVPLPEDRDLQCFVPLEGLLNNYIFAFDEPKMDNITSCKLRASRVLQFGAWLSEREEYNFLKMRREAGENNVVFEMSNSVPTDLVDRSISSISQVESAMESVVHSSSTGCSSIKAESTSESAHDLHGKAQTTASQVTVSGVTTTTQTPSVSTDAVRKYRNNVAMQAILKKIDQESTKVSEAQKETLRTDSPSRQEMEKSDLLSTHNSQKTVVTASEDRRSGVNMQVLQNRGVICREKDPFPPLVSQEKDVAYSHLGAHNESSSYVSENMKMKHISFSKMLQQIPPSRPHTEPSAQYTSLGMTNRCVAQSSVRDSKNDWVTTAKTNTELLGVHALGDVSSFSQPLFKPSLCQLADIQDLHSTPGYNMSSPQLHPQSDFLGSEHSFNPQTQYSDDANKGFEGTYSVEGTIYNSDFSDVSENSKIGLGNLLDQSVTGSNQSDFHSSGINLTYSDSDTQIYEDLIGKVRPPPGYGSIHVPNPSLTWWKQAGTPSYPIITQRKLNTDSGNIGTPYPPGHESIARQYFPMQYDKQPSQQNSLPMGSESITETDTGYINSLRNIKLADTATNANLHNKVIGSHRQVEPIYSKSESSLKNCYPGAFTAYVTTPLYGVQEGTEQIVSDVSTHNLGSYIEGGSVFPIPPRQPGTIGENSRSLFSSAQWSAPVPTQSLQQGTNLNSLSKVNHTDGNGVAVATSNFGAYTPGGSLFSIPSQGFTSTGANNTYSLFSSTPWMTPTLTEGSSSQPNIRESNEFESQVAPRHQPIYGPVRTVFPESASGTSLFSSTVGMIPTSVQATQGQIISGPQTAKATNEFGNDSAWSGVGSSALKRLLEQQNQLNEVPSDQKVT